jgi:hypothetical protein
LAPSPLLTLVTKNDMLACWACTAAVNPIPTNAAVAQNRSPIVLAIDTSHLSWHLKLRTPRTKNPGDTFVYFSAATMAW